MLYRRISFHVLLGKKPLIATACVWIASRAGCTTSTKEVDKNGDGEIDFQEFFGWRAVAVSCWNSGPLPGNGCKNLKREALDKRSMKFEQNKLTENLWHAMSPGKLLSFCNFKSIFPWSFMELPKDHSVQRVKLTRSKSDFLSYCWSITCCFQQSNVLCALC